MTTDDKNEGTESVRTWSDDSMLETISNPSRRGYEIKIQHPEITFLGVKNQPDFAQLWLTMYPKENVIELKSLKFYFHQFRNKILSYERLINVVFDDLMKVYEPDRMRVVMQFRPRGGLSSRLTIDSDWKIRGGDEKYRDWIGQTEEWS
jgi:7-cyano-7-deazaguanine reductase